MKKLRMRRLFFLMGIVGSIGFANSVFASAFQLWEQDGASIGNYHAGRAAIAADASTAYYNPAGLVRLPNQQLVVSPDVITTDFTFDGTIAVFPINNAEPMQAEAQGGTFNFVPDAHYSSPITENLFFGLSAVAPFGLKTDYGRSSPVRYAATLTSLKVIDISPSLGFAINKKLSIGVGLDIEHATANFDVIAGLFFPEEFDTKAKNSASSNGLGYHVGLLYQHSPATRIGLSYHSKVTLNFRDGDSKFIGPLANFMDDEPGGIQSTEDLRTDITLPATTSLSIFHTINPIWDVMGTVSYTQWNVLDTIVLQNVAGILEEDDDFLSSNDITVVIPQNYRNTWNIALGANYHVNKKFFIRTGLGYDQTPANNHDRNLQLPDNTRYIVALGAHIQALPTLGFDIGWSHLFAKAPSIDVVQPIGAQVTTTKGSVDGSADVYGFQMTWDII